MVVKIDKSFQKDIRKLNNPTLNQKIATLIEQIKKVTSIAEIEHLKKLRTSKNCFRIRVGEYRIGLIIIGSEINFIRCLHRKEIYNFFPK